MKPGQTAASTLGKSDKDCIIVTYTMIDNKMNLVKFVKDQNLLLNPDRIYVYQFHINKADLKLLAFGDPIDIHFCWPTQSFNKESDVSFKDVLDSFPFAYILNLRYLPKNWLKDVISANRILKYKKIDVVMKDEENFEINDLRKLFQVRFFNL